VTRSFLTASLCSSQVCSYRRGTMKWPELFQGLTVVGGGLSAILGAVMLKWKLSGARDLKRIDVSAEWQTQMLSRISAVEAELARERLRGDELEREAFRARSKAAELEWELERSKAERHDFQVRLQSLTDHNQQLQKQNQALGRELRELHRQISGYPIPTIPPPVPQKKR